MEIGGHAFAAEHGTIAGLKPDLIIADTSRHKAAYDQLRKIAPVLLLDSRYGGFTDILNQDQIIGDVVGKSTEMKAKITELQQKIKGIAGEIKPGQTAMFGASRENTLDVHTGSTFAGGLLTELGFKVPDNTGGKDIYDIDLEHRAGHEPRLDVHRPLPAGKRGAQMGTGVALEGPDGGPPEPARVGGPAAVGPFAWHHGSQPDGRSGQGGGGKH